MVIIFVCETRKRLCSSEVDAEPLHRDGLDLLLETEMLSA